MVPGLSGSWAVGGLDFFENANMVSSWRGVRYEDEVTLSLLQQRLNDLGKFSFQYPQTHARLIITLADRARTTQGQPESLHR